MIKTLRKISALAVLGAIALSAGCAATPSTYEGMIPDSFDIAKTQAKSVSVSSSGGQETSAMGKSQISNQTFKKAVEESIVKSKAFSQVIQGNNGDYQLTVLIIGMDQPSFGLDFTVKMEAGWTLKRVNDGQVVWQKIIKSEHTATTSDAFAGVTRLRLANEGAAKNNIKQGLAEISQLNL